MTRQARLVRAARGRGATRPDDFGTRKAPPGRASVKAYDERSADSNGLYRWARERGCLFRLPVDRERTVPGGRVYLTSDVADITDWITSALNGLELRMSKTGKVYVKGQNGLTGELALVFGRYPQIGTNDGLLAQIAESTGNRAYAEIGDPQKLVDALLKDVDGYQAWKRSGGMDAETRALEEREAFERGRDEAEARQRWEDSGMGVLDYVKSRIEEGDPAFDLDWETAREIANTEAWALEEVVPYEGDVPFSVRRGEGAGAAARAAATGQDTGIRMSVARVGESKPFVLLDRTNAIDWNSKEKVREYLTTLVGKGEVSLADSRRIRIGRELPREYTRSKYAEKAFRNIRLRKLRGKTAQHLDELIVASGERSGEQSRHKVREGGVYYRRTVDFGVMGHEVRRGYTAELLTYEVGGEERLYDLVNIKEKPTLTDSLQRTDRGALEILSPNRVGLTGDIISQSAAGAQGGVAKFSVGNLYTGSAADYERPSLHAVGTGEGSQVYGWGLYASSVRGVAEGYANRGDTFEVRRNGEKADPSKDGAAWQLGRFFRAKNPVKAALADARERIRQGDQRDFYEKVVKDLKAGNYEVVRGTQNVYEQTFFTDRAPGDESHLLNWYETVSKENWKRIIGAVKSIEGWQELNSVFANPSWAKRASYDNAEEVYNHFLPKVLQELNGLRGTPKEVSEFLARAGIDGVKYPVDSYGKTVKDGDKAGWNYVSFRDDNIRVDHKWTDGVARFGVGRVNASELPSSDIFTFRPKAENLPGGVRVADAPENMGELSNYGLTASRELMNATTTPLSQLGRLNPMSLPVSELLALWKQLTGRVKGPDVKARLPGFAKHGRGGELTIAADVFGIVDRTDMTAEKARLKQHGFFQNEDPDWAAAHTPREIRNEKSRSDEQLGRQLTLLGERRVEGIEAGGQAAARGVFAHEIAQIAMNLPRQPGVIGRVQKIGDGVRKAVAAKVRADGARGAENVERKMRQEAGDFLDWAYGGPQTDPASGEAVSRGKSLSLKELTDAMFGAFLTMPAEMKSRAPSWYDAVVDTIAQSPKLASAFRELSIRGVSTRAHAEVYAAVRRSMSRETERRLAELKADIEAPIPAGGLADVAKEHLLVAFHDRMAPTVVRIDAKTRAYVKAKREVIRQMRKRGAPSSEIEAVEAEIERFTGNVKRTLNELEISRMAWERGAANEGMVYVDKMRELELEAGERWGLTQEDRSVYLDQMRVIETQGRAGSFGEDGAQARAILGDMARRLGAEKWAHLEDYGRRFHAIIEQEILNDPRVSEMLGDGFVNYMRTQAHYVATKRVHSVEELDAIEQARADARARGLNGGDDVVTQMFDYAGELGGWDAKLVGSFASKKEVRSATWERHEKLMQATRRNHLVIETRDALLAAGVEGVRDLPRAERDVPQGSRYGLLNYVENGEKRTLVVPRQIADGFKNGGREFALAMRVNAICRKLMIDWNLGYAPVDASRNLGSIEKHMPGMHETPAKAIARAVAPGTAGLTQLVAQSLAKHAKPLAAGVGVLPGFRNSIYPFVAEAHEIVKYLQDPNDFQRRVWAARDTGDAAEEARLFEIQQKARRVLKGNMFVSFAARTTGRATEGFANDFFNRHGMEIERPAPSASRMEWIRRALKSKRNPFNMNVRQIEYNDMFAKVVAYLHDRQRYGLERSAAESGVLVKQNVGLGEVERRGADTRAIQATVNQFFNAIEKGFTQTIRASKERPGETLAKCASSWTGRFFAVLAANGVLSAVIRWMFDDDEEKVRASPLGDAYDYLQACERANRNLSTYTRENYNVTPLWNSPDGYTSVCLALPLDDQDRLFSWAADHAAGEVAEKMGLMRVGPERGAVGAASAATLKTLAPDFTFSTPIFDLLRLAFAAATGENPRDNFRGAPMYDPNTWAMRGESLENNAQYALETGKILWNMTGGRSFYQFGNNGVDPKAGEGDAPEWLGIAVNKIPIASPILKRFVKIQCGSPEKDAQPVKDELKRVQATITYCQRKLMQESANLDGALNRVDPKRYAEMLTKWKETYGLSDAAMRKIEVNFLNAWRDLENKDLKERKRTINVIKRGRKMGIEKADELLRSGQL